MNTPSHQTVIRLPFTIRKRGGKKLIIAADGAAGTSSHNHSPNSALIKAVVRAHRWQRLLEEGAYATMKDLAAAEKISPSYISRLMRLTLLAPDILQGILDGRHTGEIDGADCETTPELWDEQLQAAAPFKPGQKASSHVSLVTLQA